MIIYGGIDSNEKVLGDMGIYNIGINNNNIINILNKNRKKYLENNRFGDKLMCGISFYGKLIYP
jgi:hypothetical protein